MKTLRITHVCGPSDYAKVHRLRWPASSLTAANGASLACGRTFHSGAGAAGFDNYTEDAHAGMCQQCRVAQRTPECEECDGSGIMEYEESREGSLVRETCAVCKGTGYRKVVRP